MDELTSQLDTSGALKFFLSLLKLIRVEVLDKFNLPGLEVSYWDFLIALAVLTVVVVVMVSGVRIGTVARRSGNASKQDGPSSTFDGKYHDGEVVGKPSGYFKEKSSSSSTGLSVYDGF